MGSYKVFFLRLNLLANLLVLRLRALASPCNPILPGCFQNPHKLHNQSTCNIKTGSMESIARSRERGLFGGLTTHSCLLR